MTSEHDFEKKLAVRRLGLPAVRPPCTFGVLHCLCCAPSACTFHPSAHRFVIVQGGCQFSCCVIHSPRVMFRPQPTLAILLGLQPRVHAFLSALPNLLRLSFRTYPAPTYIYFGRKVRWAEHSCVRCSSPSMLLAKHYNRAPRSLNPGLVRREHKSASCQVRRDSRSLASDDYGIFIVCTPNPPAHPHRYLHPPRVFDPPPGTVSCRRAQMLCLHVPSLLPHPFADMDTSSVTQAAALAGVGLLYQVRSGCMIFRQQPRWRDSAAVWRCCALQ